MPFLSPAERQTLAHLCDTLAPALEPEPGQPADLFRACAADVELAPLLEFALEQVTTAAERTQLRLLLRLLEQAWFNRAMAGRMVAFSAVDQPVREAILRTWATHRLPLLRGAFQTFKRLAVFLFYTNQLDDKPNPTWAAFHYVVPPPAAATLQPRLPVLSINGETELTADVLVIGSGAGGGVVAAELAAAGQDVLIVEKGPYYAETEFHGREKDAMASMFERAGALVSADLGMLLLAGSTLGGGTTVNWSASFRTPDDVLQEWARDYGFTAAASPDLQTSLDAVTARMHVDSDESRANPQNCALEDGCNKLGYDLAVIPRNVKGCVECGFCNFGCRYGAKQGTLSTYLRDASAHGARILVGAQAEQITHSGGEVRGARLRITNADGSSHSVQVRARRVIVAAGSIQTPALLLRSGLRNPHIGAHLHLHPTTSIYGLFDHRVRGWEGAPMTRYSREFANMDGRGYGVRLETAPLHPGIAALAVPWIGARQHREVMSQLEHLAGMIVLTRDRDGGRVTVGREGQPVVDYRLSRYDAAHLLRGTVEALRVEHAAGAFEVSSPHTPPLSYRRDRDGDFETYLQTVAGRGIATNRFALFSAHQMSSCRIGGSPSLGAVDPTGQTYEVRGLFVADGSTLPTASGVNPMVTIMATAHHLAQQIKSKL